MTRSPLTTSSLSHAAKWINFKDQRAITISNLNAWLENPITCQGKPEAIKARRREENLKKSSLQCFWKRVPCFKCIALEKCCRNIAWSVRVPTEIFDDPMLYIADPSTFCRNLFWHEKTSWRPMLYFSPGRTSNSPRYLSSPPEIWYHQWPKSSMHGTKENVSE